jgi:apoptosis-inducing factor 3
MITLDGGKEHISYEVLVLAPGATPRKLPVEGADLENVYTFRGIQDSKKVDAGNYDMTAFIKTYFLDLKMIFFSAAQEGKHLVVIGSSFISMEIVAAVAKRKLASIDVIGMEEYPFQTVLGSEVGKGLQKASLCHDCSRHI